jgi:hypothetical protein
MPSWDRLKPVAGVGVVIAAALTWVFAFRTGVTSSNDWNQEWNIPSDTRGKGVYIGNREVETPIEREKRLAKMRLLNGELGAMKKNVLGDKDKVRGNEIVPERPPPPPGFNFNPREACIQMKMEYPERYGNVDCMSDQYDGVDPWWETSRSGH